MIIGKPQGRKGYGCWLNFMVTRKLQNHKKQPGCRNPAPVHALIPFYSTHRTLCPNHPIIARSTASVGKPCPCACTNTVPLARKSQFVLAGKLPSSDAGAILEIERLLKHVDQFTRQCKVRFSCNWNGISTCTGTGFSNRMF